MADTRFTFFPDLNTERLTLRQLSVNDRQDIFALRSDPEINRYLDRQSDKTIEDSLNFINKVTDNIKGRNSVYWVITLKGTGVLVGTVCLFNFSQEKKSGEIGYELMTRFQGQGIMKEALGLVIDYAFQTLKFQYIVAYTHHENLRSGKLLAKLSFAQSSEVDEENADLNVFTLTNLM